MASYIVETYLPKTRAGELNELATDARLAAEAKDPNGRTIRFVGGTLLPEKEICLLRFESVSRELVDAVVRQAGITHDRIVVAVESKQTRKQTRSTSSASRSRRSNSDVHQC
ncbi:MAG: hypothetical protein WED12_08365 [Chloroflexota bacterium]